MDVTTQHDHHPALRAALGEAAWYRLSTPVRERFSRMEAVARCGGRTVFEGAMQVVAANPAGIACAHAARLAGTPIATGNGSDVPCTVTVSGHASGGVTWTRCYRFGGGALFARGALTVRSTKHCHPRLGLCEALGAGLQMQLRLRERHGALEFISRGYAIASMQHGEHALPLPQALWPGETRVLHEDLGDGWFRFALWVRHPHLGELFHQDGRFHLKEHAAACATGE